MKVNIQELVNNLRDDIVEQYYHSELLRVQLSTMDDDTVLKFDDKVIITEKHYYELVNNIKMLETNIKSSYNLTRPFAIEPIEIGNYNKSNKLTP